MDQIATMLRAEAPAAPAGPPVLAGAEIEYAVTRLPVGRMLLATRRADGALLASRFAADDAEADALLDRLARRVSPSVLRGALDEPRRQLDAYLEGRRTAFDLTVDPVLASPFQREVLAGLGRVGYGRTTSYGELAAAIGRPGASRAVGTALGANPLCVVLPCHRVLAASGKLSGYAGGPEAKRLLLDLEARTAA